MRSHATQSPTASTHSAAELPSGESASDAPIASKVSRDPKYAHLTAADVAHFTAILGEEGVVRDQERLAGYNTDWMKKFRQSTAGNQGDEGALQRLPWSLAHLLSVALLADADS